MFPCERVKADEMDRQAPEMGSPEIKRWTAQHHTGEGQARLHRSSGFAVWPGGLRGSPGELRWAFDAAPSWGRTGGGLTRSDVAILRIGPLIGLTVMGGLRGGERERERKEGWGGGGRGSVMTPAS